MVGRVALSPVWKPSRPSRAWHHPVASWKRLFTASASVRPPIISLDEENRDGAQQLADALAEFGCCYLSGVWSLVMSSTMTFELHIHTFYSYYSTQGTAYRACWNSV